MKTLSEYRAEARQVLKGNWFSSAVFVLLYLVIAGIASSVVSSFAGSNTTASSTTSVLGTLLVLPIGYGLLFGFLGQGRGREMQVGDLFGHFNLRVYSTLILKGIYTFLWFLLLIIPGIVKSYSYAMTEFLMMDNPELKNNEAIEKSMEMMQGNKWRLFLLDLTFIGWFILGIFTFCIGWLWVYAYLYQTRVMFYETLKAEAEEEIATITVEE